MNSYPALSRRVSYLLSPAAIRQRAHRLVELSEQGGTHFEIHGDRLDPVVDQVLAVTRELYPDLAIPFHSRWGHFVLAGRDRADSVRTQLGGDQPLERARALLDLVVISVLLDAGAGPDWRYHDRESGESVGRSEGLALASLAMFAAGLFSSDPSQPLRVDAEALTTIHESQLRQGFQVDETNPLVGLSGRVALLRNLGKTLTRNTACFCDQRPGNLLDFLIESHGNQWSASQLLAAVLLGFGSIWPGRITLDGVNLGDVWHHPLLIGSDDSDALVPFHKLSQWLTYSMIEPIREAGIALDGVDALTGLAEYRNGGLLLDSGLISLRDPHDRGRSFRPGDPVIVEWRALTIVMLDRIAERLRSRLDLSPTELPLAKILEGGTWHAGRREAFARRPDGSPPLRLISDGTVF